jgi:hypothetical protein
VVISQAPSPLLAGVIRSSPYKNHTGINQSQHGTHLGFVLSIFNNKSFRSSSVIDLGVSQTLGQGNSFPGRRQNETPKFPVCSSPLGMFCLISVSRAFQVPKSGLKLVADRSFSFSRYSNTSSIVL